MFDSNRAFLHPFCIHSASFRVRKYFNQMKKNWRDSASYSKTLNLEYEAINWAVYNLGKGASPGALAKEASAYFKDVYGQEVM